MASAARAGDMTSHGTPLSAMAGSPNVQIGGQAAWRARIDVHTCPVSDGPKPHTGGMVVKGSTKVYINNFPAVREGDQIVESGPPNTIAKGLLKVQIGD
jgi:uncharacterized Zn-binding protein involved in type VI secretion